MFLKNYLELKKYDTCRMVKILTKFWLLITGIISFPLSTYLAIISICWSNRNMILWSKGLCIANIASFCIITSVQLFCILHPMPSPWKSERKHVWQVILRLLIVMLFSSSLVSSGSSLRCTVTIVVVLSKCFTYWMLHEAFCSQAQCW